MRTHRVKSAHLPPSIFRLHFDSYPLPLFRRFIVGAAIEKNFLFFYFFKTLLQLVKFSLGIPYQLLSLLVLYLSDFDLEFTSSRLRFSTLIIILDSVFSILYFDSFLLVEFSSHQFRLVSALSILYFNSSTLYLFCLL